MKLNRLEKRVSIVEGSFTNIKKLFAPESFSYVISNPPFWKAGSGRTSPDREKIIARTEVMGTIEELIEAASYLLPSKGRAGIIYAAERITDLLCAMRKEKIEPKRLVPIYPYPDEKAQFIFVEGVKNAKTGQCIVEPALILHEPSGEYTSLVKEMIGVRS